MLRRRGFLAICLLTALRGAPAWSDAARGLRLLMVESKSCLYCAAWRAEIGPGYGGSAIGRRAPLVPVNIDGPYPDGLALARRPALTPTFILLRDGIELGRVEGYAGADQFYPLLAQMMAHAGIPVQQGGKGVADR